MTPCDSRDDDSALGSDYLQYSSQFIKGFDDDDDDVPLPTPMGKNKMLPCYLTPAGGLTKKRIDWLDWSLLS